MKIKQMLTALVVVAFMIFGPVVASAAVNNRVPDLSDENKSLEVFFFIQKNGVDTPIQGAEMGINRIASLTVEGGSAQYTVTEPYLSLQKTKSGLDVTFDGLTFSDSVKLAATFAGIADDPQKTAVTDKHGKCKFTDLEEGIYLVREISAEGDAAGYKLIEPYMIAVPYPENYSGEYVWDYEVLSEPKTVIVPVDEPSPPEPTEPEPDPSPEPEPSPKPETSPETESSESSVSKPASHSTPSSTVTSSQTSPDDGHSLLTGDNTSVFILVIGLLGSLGAMMFFLGSRKDNKNEK